MNPRKAVKWTGLDASSFGNFLTKKVKKINLDLKKVLKKFVFKEIDLVD